MRFHRPLRVAGCAGTSERYKPPSHSRIVAFDVGRVHKRGAMEVKNWTQGLNQDTGSIEGEGKRHFLSIQWKTKLDF